MDKAAYGAKWQWTNRRINTHTDFPTENQIAKRRLFGYSPIFILDLLSGIEISIHYEYNWHQLFTPKSFRIEQGGEMEKTWVQMYIFQINYNVGIKDKQPINVEYFDKDWDTSPLWRRTNTSLWFGPLTQKGSPAGRSDKLFFPIGCTNPGREKCYKRQYEPSTWSVPYRE